MKDFETNRDTGNIKPRRSRESPFFGLARPYFDFIGKGKIYSLFYLVMAIFNLLIPLVVIFVVIEFGFLQNSGSRVVVTFILSWLIIAFASWIGFQLWWYRRLSVKKYESSDFIATPVVSELIQTFGEWLGTFTGITGFGVGIIAAVFLNDTANSFFPDFGLGMLNFGLLAIFAGPVIGFFTIIIFRFLAEQIRIFTSIANKTGEIAEKLNNQR